MNVHILIFVLGVGSLEPSRFFCSHDPGGRWPLASHHLSGSQAGAGWATTWRPLEAARSALTCLHLLVQMPGREQLPVAPLLRCRGRWYSLHPRSPSRCLFLHHSGSQQAREDGSLWTVSLASLLSHLLSELIRGRPQAATAGGCCGQGQVVAALF